MSRALVSVCRVPETTPRLLINKEKSGQQVRLNLLLGNALKVSGSFHIIINFFFAVYQPAICDPYEDLQPTCFLCFFVSNLASRIFFCIYCLYLYIRLIA